MRALTMFLTIFSTTCLAAEQQMTVSLCNLGNLSESAVARAQKPRPRPCFGPRTSGLSGKAATVFRKEPGVPLGL